MFARICYLPDIDRCARLGLAGLRVGRDDVVLNGHPVVHQNHVIEAAHLNVHLLEHFTITGKTPRLVS